MAKPPFWKQSFGYESSSPSRKTTLRQPWTWSEHLSGEPLELRRSGRHKDESSANAFYLLVLEKERSEKEEKEWEKGRGREKETLICYSTHSCIHWLFHVCDWLGIEPAILIYRNNTQLNYPARALFTFYNIAFSHAIKNYKNHC